MRVGVLGGGFAGLAAAIAFRRTGHDVTVYEKSAGPAAAGGAISLAPNALTCLRLLGVGDKVSTQPWSNLPATVRSADGRVLVRSTMGRLTGGSEFACVTRAQLISWLTAELPSDCVRYASPVRAVTAAGVVDTDDGTERFDLVVAADGARGIARSTLWPHAAPLRPAGITGWAWIVDRSLSDGFGTIWGAHTDFGILPLVDGRTYVYGGTTPEHAALSAFRTWPQPLPDLIDSATPSTMITPDIYEARPPRDLACGRVVLIGDAAHTMRPTFGQGAALAMEDAITLARGGVTALRRRWPRMMTLYAASKAGSYFATPGRPTLTAARDFALRATPDPLFGVMAGSVSRWRPPVATTPA